MKKGSLLNKEISSVIAGMGPTDMLTIGDCGLPVPENVRRIDLALKKGVPTFEDTLKVVLEELCVEKVIIASEIKAKNADLYGTLKNVFADIEIEEIPHEEFKEKTKLSKAVIRTGEYRPYANIILQSGVTF